MPGIKEYIKQNIVPQINTLILSNDKRLVNLKVYQSTWKIGYWEDVGFPILDKVLGKKSIN